MNVKKQFTVNSFLFLMLFVLLFEGHALGGATSKNKMIFSSSYEGIPLSEILPDLTSRTGYNFTVPEDWLGLNIYGKFSHVTLDDFFHRIFKNKNFSLIINEEKREIVVVGFPSSSQSISSSTDFLDPNTKVDPMSGLLVKDLQALHEWQLQEIERKKTDPTAVDPYSGMTYAYLEKIGSKQLDEINNNEENRKIVSVDFASSSQSISSSTDFSDPNTEVDPMSGLLVKDLQALHAWQLQEIEEEKADPTAVDPYSGMSYGYLKKIASKQLGE